MSKNLFIINQEIINKVSSLKSLPRGSTRRGDIATIHYFLYNEGIINQDYACFLKHFNLYKDRCKKGLYPTIEEEESSRLKFEFFEIIETKIQQSLSAIHLNAYQKALQCTTGKFALDYLSKMDPDMRQQQIEISHVQDVNSLSTAELEVLLLKEIQKEENEERDTR